MPRKCDCREAAKALVAAGYSIYAAAKILGVSPRAVRKWVAERKKKGTVAEEKNEEGIADLPEWLRQNIWVQRLRGQT
ncbi:MAG: helix-turn-helix domain-containing protein [Pyrobaculum sp.]